MKTASIGDTHGTAVAVAVRKIIDEYDKIIFAGDYVDSSFIDNQTIIKNLSEIIELKKKYPGKIILLWGNHDVHYLLGNEYSCSGYRPEMKQELHEIFYSNYDLFQLSYQAGNYLWTHAGISAWWFEFRFSPFAGKQLKKASVAELLNLAFEKRYKPIFDVGYLRGGDAETGGPLWCDIEELENDPWTRLNQIAGHNRVDKIQRITCHDKEVVFIDVLHNADTVDESFFYYKETDNDIIISDRQ